MAVSKRTRYEVLVRDNHTCRYCRSTEGNLVIDHVIPVALGGSDDPSNLVAACKDCNAGKAASNPDAATVAQVDEDAVRWAAAMRKAVDDWLVTRDDAWAYGNVVAKAWDDGNATYRWNRAALDDDWTDTVERWRSLGLPAELVAEAVGVAMRRRSVDNWNVWQYVCGIVWAKLTELQEAAAAALASPPVGEPGSQLNESYWRGYVDSMLEVESKWARLAFRSLSRVVDGPSSWNAPLKVDA